MLQINGISKSYGQQVLFRDLSCAVNPGERVGLVGRNGYGKTTLFNIILGKTPPDTGEIITPKGYRTGYLEQLSTFSETDIISEAASTLPDIYKLETWRAEKILAGLGFDPECFGNNPQTLSAGFRIRLNLARTILSDPDLLLLDEPNNYLDIISIRWLTGFLKAWKRSLILISHDRDFMDSITTHTMIIHRKKLRKFKGGTDNLFRQIREEEEVHEKTRLNYEKKREQTMLYVERFRAKARMAKSVQSTVKALKKQEKIIKLEQVGNLEFSFNEDPLRAPYVMKVNGLSFGYNPRSPLISNFSLEVGSRDRIFVIGKNGKGKTTLLKLLSGDLTPESGRIKLHPKTRIGRYMESDIARLDPLKNVCEEISSAERDISHQQARNICGALMFEGEAAMKKISIISGGEKSRVLLGKVLASPCNLLILDEPTSHLDLESCETLAEAIDRFNGAAIIVTHNEGLLRRLAERLVIYTANSIRVFEGPYTDFLESGGWEEEQSGTSSLPSAVKTKTVSTPVTDKKKIKKMEALIRQERFRVLNPLEKTSKKCEQDIIRLENMIEANNMALIRASETKEAASITALSFKDRKLREETALLYKKLENLLESIEAQTLKFEKKLSEISGPGFY